MNENQVFDLRAKGLSRAEVSIKLNIPPHRIRYLERKHGILPKSTREKIIDWFREKVEASKSDGHPTGSCLYFLYHIAKGINVSETTVRKTLYRMKKDGIIISSETDGGKEGRDRLYMLKETDDAHKEWRSSPEGIENIRKEREELRRMGLR